MSCNFETMNVDDEINPMINVNIPSNSSGSVSLLRSNFTIHDRTGVRTSIFTGNLSNLKRLMSMHGILDSSFNTRRCRSLLIEHFISASCMELSEHSSKSIACKCIADTCTSPNSMKHEINDILSSVSSTDLPTDCLLQVAGSLSIPFHARDSNVRFNVQDKFMKEATILRDIPFDLIPIHQYFDNFDRLSLTQLHYRCVSHGIHMPSRRCTRDDLRKLIIDHLASSGCSQNENLEAATPPACSDFLKEWLGSSISNDSFDIYTMSQMVRKNGPSLKQLKRYLGARVSHLPFAIPPTATLHNLRSLIKSHIKRLSKGKTVRFSYSELVAKRTDYNAKLAELATKWPDHDHCSSQSLKDSCIKRFRECTSSSSLRSFTCASCSENKLLSERTILSNEEFDEHILDRPDTAGADIGRVPSERWLDSDPRYAPPILSLQHHPSDILVDLHGVQSDPDTGLTLYSFCNHCYSSIKNNKLPALSLANRLYLGDIPDELADLTVVEQSVIARCRATCYIIKLKEENSHLELSTSQRGFKGHVIVYPQDPSAIAQKLPPAMEEIVPPICVLFVGSNVPTEQWLKEHAKPLAVRPAKIRQALIWLRDHNRLYKDIEIDENVLHSMDEYCMPPYNIEVVSSNAGDDGRTSRYDASDSLVPDILPVGSTETPWQNVVITNIDASAPSNELRAAALRHVKKNGGGYLQIPHNSNPANEFNNPDLFPLMYPTLFPYGIGGFDDRNRSAKLSMRRQVKHFLQLSDRRFQEHPTFIFTAFNILQRRAMLLHTKLKTEKSNFKQMAEQFASVSSETIHAVAEKLKNEQQQKISWSDDERKIADLMQQVNTITGYVEGSAAARVHMRNEIRGLMIDQGLPSFYITINPADVYNPILKVLAGENIDIENLLPEQVPDYWKQSILVAKNPIITAKFFNIYMKAFLSCLVGYDPTFSDLNGSVFGLCKAYYGCVEAQGRGTLHCHMLIWLHGGLNPNEIKEKLLSDPSFKEKLIFYLEDLISNDIPIDPGSNFVTPSSLFHPCSVRGMNLDNTDDNDLKSKRQKDMHLLTKSCQSHTHSTTCYKYYNGKGVRRCRFDMYTENRRTESTVNPETGEICRRCLDGLVNNFNATILEAIRCNMDIKFIGSGASAKAILYYITDYITKSQLKTHVAYAALELAIKKLEQYHPNESDQSLRAKQMLQKCAYALVSHQELSAQQVASYLMDFEDHFTSHTFRPLYWTSFERRIEVEQPSPECYQKKYITSNNPNTIEDNIHTHIESQLEENVNDHDETMTSFQQDTLDHSEIAICIDEKGKLHGSVDPVTDYRLRGRKLEDICVWDFIARTKKVTKKSVESKKKNFHNDGDVETDDFEIENDDDDLNEEVNNTTDDFINEDAPKESILTSIRRNRPKIGFLDDLHSPEMHDQLETHLIYVTHPRNRSVPVPLGPGLPRRDRKETYTRFCRLMLILFKPWRKATDLRSEFQSWEDAYVHFLEDCSPEYIAKMNNMQVLHECRDSRDDHFAQRRNDAHRDTHPSRGEKRSLIDDDFAHVECTENEILNHLLEVHECQSEKKTKDNVNILHCLEYAEASGMYNAHHPDLNQTTSIVSQSGEVELAHDSYEEDRWTHEYDIRRNALKKKNKPVANIIDCNSTSDANDCPKFSDGSAFRDALEKVPSLQPQYHQDFVNVEKNVDIEKVAQTWTLNNEQTRAFRIIAQHSYEDKPDQLRMFLSGAGGTGKSRVIDALSDFFAQRGQARRMRLCAFTGVAARNIKGMTLHSALSLSQRANKKEKLNSLHTNRDLIAMWEGVDYLIIDEVSMIGCQLMCNISKALSEAKSQNNSPFGGVNIIFAGDCAQLPPVGESKLYSHIRDSTFRSATKICENNVFGKLLWLSVQTVVVLHEIKRQQGTANQPFVDLLSRLRRGECTYLDYQLLQSRIMTVNRPNWHDIKMRQAPIIVSENVIKDKLNEK